MQTTPIVREGQAEMAFDVPAKRYRTVAPPLEALCRQVIACRRCPRLVRHRERTAQEKVRRYRDWTYWGRPVPGFGDPAARLLVVGLAPAAHGGNRTAGSLRGTGAATSCTGRFIAPDSRINQFRSVETTALILRIAM